MTPDLAEPVTTLITHLIYPQYNLLTSQINVYSDTHSSSSCINLTSHLHYSLVLTFTPTSTSSQTEPGESMIFQPVLQAYPTRHSWIVTTHISLGNLECHWKLFKRQTIRTQQFLRSPEQHPSASTQLLTTLQLELTNIQDIYTSNEAAIRSAINLLNSNQLQTIYEMQKKPHTLPRNGTQLAHRNSHDQRYMQHQGQDKSTNSNTIITT